MGVIPESAIALRDALRAGEVTSREVTEHFLGRIADREELGAFLEVTGEQAIDAASAADAHFASLHPDERATLPALHGLPTAHKDLVEVAGVVTTRGSAAIPHPIAESDHPGVRTLRDAGAVSLGKTQVPEFGLNAYSENLIAPPARNPFDLARTPGGSSGGSAAAVAAGLLPFAPGSDGGGSIRIPALACNLIGLKPGLGAIPSDIIGGLPDPFGVPRLAVSGPIGHTVADTALLFDAMCGRGSEETQERNGSARGPAELALHRAAEITGLRIGVSAASPFEPAVSVTLSGEAVRAWERAATQLVELGHHLEIADFNYDERYPEAFAMSWTSTLSLLELPDGAAELLTPLTREFRDRALSRSREEHLNAASALRHISDDFRRQWAQYDVVLTPGLSSLPPPIGAFTSLSPDDDYELQCQWTPYTSMVNVAGLPAIGVPTLRVPNPTAPGMLPMGVQLIGREGSEIQLLQLAAQLMGA